MDLSHVYERTVDPDGNDSLARLARYISPGSTVLELGPATGYFTRYLTETLQCTVDCIEYSPDMAELARPMARTMWVGDLDHLNPGDKFDPQTYDFIVAADVLEHLRNPWRVMELCRPLLKPDGRFLISIPNVGHAALIAELISGRFDYRDEGLLDRTHLRLFTRKSLLEMLQRCGYRPRAVERVETMAEQTEFQRVLEEMPPVLRDYLLSHPDSLTYQFIVDAEIGLLSNDEITAHLAGVCGPEDPYFVAKVYWGGPEQQLDETRCHRQPIEIASEHNMISFDLEPGQQLSTIRLDPADRPGYLKIFRISIVEVDEQNREVTQLLDLSSPDSLRSNCRLIDVAYDETETAHRFIARTNDPQVWLSFDEPLVARSGNRLRFKADISWPRSADYLVAARIFEQIIDRLNANIASLGETITTLKSEAHQQQQLLEQVNDDRERIIREVERLQTIEPRCHDAEQRLNEIYQSKAWKMLTRWRKLKYRFVKPGPSKS